MKSERRHELQQNELADYLGRFIKRAEPYAPVAVTVVIAVIVIALGVGYFQSRSATQRSDATLLYLLNAGQADPAALGDIAANYPDTQAARLAKLSQADIYLGQGIEAMFSDRELATAGLQDAVAVYQEVFDSAEYEIVRSRAALGLARSHEALGEVEEAIAAYEQVIEIHESDAIVEVARQRIESLQSDETQEFLAWFAEQEPQSADPSLPPGMPEAGGLPEMPDISLPDFSAATDQLPDTDEESTEASDQPAAEDAQPPAEQPTATEGDDEAAAETPATDDASVEMTAPEQPTAETPAEPTEAPADTGPAEQPAEPAEEPTSGDEAAGASAEDNEAVEEVAAEDDAAETDSADPQTPTDGDTEPQ